MVRDDESQAGGRSAPAPGQGAAVAEAIEGPVSRDIDRWQMFLKSQVAAMWVAPSTPDAAEKPVAGLARNGGVIEGETSAPPSTPTR